MNSDDSAPIAGASDDVPADMPPRVAGAGGAHPEEVIRRQEQLFRRFFENLPEPALLVWWDAGKSPVVAEVNHALSDLTGWSAEHLQGRSCHAVITHEGAWGQIEEFYRTIGLREKGVCRCRVRTREGAFIPVEMHGVVFPKPGEDSAGVLLLLKDRRPKIESMRVERIAQEILECIPHPVFYKDSFGRYRGCNRAFGEWMGLPPSEIIGKTARELDVSEANAQLFEQRDAELLEAPEAPQIYQATVRWKNGTQREVIFHKACVLWGDGPTRGIVGVVMDVTRLRELNAALGVSENQYRQVFLSVSDAILVTDGTSGVIQDINPAAESLYLMSRVGLIGKTLRDLEVEQVPPPNLSRSNVRWHRRSSGEVFAVEVDEAVLQTKERELRVFTVRNVDIREQTESALRAAKELAESAARMKSDFLNLASHELRTPLTPILGISELLLEEPFLPEHHRKIQLIHNAAQHLTRLIGDLLDVARIEAGKAIIEVASVQLPHELKQLVDQFKPAAERKGLYLRMALDEALPKWVLTDINRIRQILGNLLGNAVKFTVSGGIELRASVVQTGLGRKAQLVVEVADSGPGIPAGKQDMIFDPFSQADTSVTRHHGGAGLGLTIARQLARLMGGDITVDAAEIGGCCFKLRVAVEIAPSTASAELTSAAPAALQGRRILVAEPDPITAATLLDQLDFLGAHTVLVGSAQDVLRYVGGQGVDGILFNMNLPDVAGERCVSRILASLLPGHGVVLVGLLSGADQDSPTLHEKPPGTAALLTYPVRLSDLVHLFGESVD